MKYDNFINGWLNKDFLIEIADEIVTLESYVPKELEESLPNYQKRKDFILNNDFTYSDEYMESSVDDQLRLEDWNAYVQLYENLFRKYPKLKGLIKDKNEYEKWKNLNLTPAIYF